MDGGAWWAAVHGVAKGWTQLSDFTFTFHFHALEKEMASHSSVLAWRIPGTGDPGGLYGVAQSQTRLKRLSSSSRMRPGLQAMETSSPPLLLQSVQQKSHLGHTWIHCCCLWSATLAKQPDTLCL